MENIFLYDDYWFSVLLDSEPHSWSRRQKYVNLNIKSDQLGRSISLFIDTSDENFEGVNAEKAKCHAENMVTVSQLA